MGHYSMETPMEGPPYLQALDSEEFVPPASIPGTALTEEVQELLDDEG